MEQTTNAEKQARYRKKDKLRRQADQMFRLWQLEPKKDRFRSEREIYQLIESVISLPHGWTDDDYLNAEKKLDSLNSEIFSLDNQILEDLTNIRGHQLPSMMGNNSVYGSNDDWTKITVENALERTSALASHIISALEISECDENEQAIALMEAIRFVGRTLSNAHGICRSDAIAVCLATIGPQYERQKAFSRQLASVLRKNIEPDILREIMEYLQRE